MRQISIATVSVLGIGLLLFVAPSRGQTAGPAKVCALLPTAELEAHFGTKAGEPRGHDAATVSMCTVDIPDHRHGASVMTNSLGVSLTVKQRLAAVRATSEGKTAQVKDFGLVGCFTGQLELGDTKLPTATCFLDKNGYISLTLRSDDAKQVSFDDVKTLLEKTAARRR
jgi:hypothetical protein